LNYKHSSMKTLTKAEEQIMQVLWKLKKGFLMEIVEGMPAPQPHKNTVATVLKVLVDKGFVRVENVGRFFRYYPAISRRQYSKSSLVNLAGNYFQGSFPSVVSFLVDENKLSIDDLELVLQQLKKSKK
jgi:BlaI family transcriptional regulator, penicillinase repressor